MCELCSVVFSYGTADVISKLATPLIAGIVGYVAFLQWKLNRATVREKLFDRRFEVFRVTQKFLTKINESISFEQAVYWEFIDACQKSSFLFDADLEKYLIKIRNRALDLELSTTLMNDPSESANRNQHVQDRYDHGVWLNDQLNVIFRVFKPYLSFARDK